MFLAYDDPQQAAAQAEQLVAMRQAAQQLRVVEDWQPRLTRRLTRLPGECLAAILGAARDQAGREVCDDVLDILHHFIANVDVPQGQAILADMVRAEGQALAEIITCHGLLGEMPDTTDWPAKLAHGPALAEAVERSWAEFRGRVGRELDEAWAEAFSLAGGPPDPRVLAERLAGPVQGWSSRLAAIAATLTHAALNGVRRELGRARPAQI